MNGINLCNCDTCAPYAPQGICAPMMPIGWCVKCGKPESQEQLDRLNSEVQKEIRVHQVLNDL